MAKIKFYKGLISLPKTTRIETITGKEYNDNYKEKLNEYRKNSIEMHEVLIKSENIILFSSNDGNSNVQEEKETGTELFFSREEFSELYQKTNGFSDKFDELSPALMQFVREEDRPNVLKKTRKP